MNDADIKTLLLTAIMAEGGSYAKFLAGDIVNNTLKLRTRHQNGYSFAYCTWGMWHATASVRPGEKELAVFSIEYNYDWNRE